MSNQNFGGQKPVYSQSFSRSGGPRRDGPPRRDHQGGRNFQNSFEQSDDNDVIQVDSRKLGCIIGSKGSNIKKMESDSGAEIQVSKERNSASTDISIRGTPEARSAAREMIQNCIEDNNRRNDHNQSRSGGYENNRRSDGFGNQAGGRFDESQWGSGSQSYGGSNNQSSGRFNNESQWGSENQSSNNQSLGRFENESQWGSENQPIEGSNNQSQWGSETPSHGGSNNQSRGRFDNESQWGSDNPQGAYDNQSRGGFDNQSRSNNFDRKNRQSDRRNNFSDANQHDDRGNQYDRRSQYNDRDRRNQRNDRRDFNRPDNSNQNYNRSNNSSANYSSNYSYNDSQASTGNNYSQPSYQQPNMESGGPPIDWQALYEESEKLAAAKLAALPPIVKNLYEEDPEVANMSPEEVARFRASHMDISVERVFGDENERKKPILNPVKTFEQAFRPYPEILQTIYAQNFKEPSPVQCQAWPIILSGEDMIGIAQTGTGKTLAFLLPALIHIESQTVPRHERVGPTVLILSPTRELALQIEKEINKYSYRGIKCICVYGGGSRRQQGDILSQRPEIVVATPGRLEDFISTDQILLESVSYVVLDEADKMLEMGFECQIRKILLKIRQDRQSIMTSATWPNGVRRLVSSYSNNPVQVVVGSLDLTAVHSVSQRIEIVPEEERRARLDEFLAGMEPDDKVIVFCSKKSVTDDIASDLMLKGVRCQSIHGDREQCDREQALHDLKTGEVHILIATDVAARGIDIPDITHIFNYDFPRNIEEYVHRIGRTGRAGKTGESISLVTRKDWGNAAELIKILEEAHQGVPDELRSMAERFEKKKSEGGFRGGGRGRGGRGGRPRY